MSRLWRWVRDTWERIPLMALVPVGAAALAVLIWGAVLLTNHTTAAQQDAQNVKAQSGPLASAVQQVCSQGGAAASALDGKGACRQASKVQSAVTAPTTAEAAAPPANQGAVDLAVDNYLAAHPPPAGQNATPLQVATATAQYLTAHPPQAGRAPTSAEIQTASNSYLTSHSADFTGKAGADGTNGLDGTTITGVDLENVPTPSNPSAQSLCVTMKNPNTGDITTRCVGNVTGPQGAKGDKGDKGDTGATGATGAQGPAGPVCPDGYHQANVTYVAEDGSPTAGVGCVVDASTSTTPTG